MKTSARILIGLVSSLTVGYFFWNSLGNKVADEDINQGVVASEHVDNPLQSISIPAETSKEARIEELKNDAKTQAIEIAQITGSSGNQNLSYEDNWCIASEDLIEDDAIYATNELNEWRLTRGNVIPRGGSLNALVKGLGVQNDEFPGLNDEYLVPYKEADRETLVRLGWEEDDIFALTTIVKSSNREVFDDQIKLQAAKQLVVLGDTSHGLNRLVIESMVLADAAKRLRNDNPKKHLKQALALIEYGIMRNDPGSLSVFVDFADNFRERLSGLNPATVLSQEDFADIKKMAHRFYDDVSQVRVDKGLSRFEDINEPKIALVQYDKKIASFYRDYPSLMTGGLFPASWKDSYLQKTPCVERRIARHNFLMTQLPDIKNRIAELEQNLN